MILGASAFLVLTGPVAVMAEEPADSTRWAILVHGPAIYTNDIDYMYHILNEHYNFTDNGIYFLNTNTSDPRVDNASTLENVRWAINTWLPSKSNVNDTIMIFFVTHGGGYQMHKYDSEYRAKPILPGMYSGRWEYNGDEGHELWESNITIPTALSESWFMKLYPKEVDADNDMDEDDVYRNIDDDVYLELDIDNDGLFWIGDGPGGAVTEMRDWDSDGVKDDLLIDADWDDLCDVAFNADVNLTQSDGEDKDNDGYIDGADINENGQDDQIGVDEGLLLLSNQTGGEMYWDDDLKSDLSNLEGKYETLIFMTQQCVEGNLSCYGGGLIDDLSRENRIIMTASNETSVANLDLEPKDGYSEWSGAFMHALHGIADADNNTDGHISMLEAWQYAWNNDKARKEGLETPWLDDDGNGEPTFFNVTDMLDPDDGALADVTWFPKVASHLNATTWCPAVGERVSATIWIDGNQTGLSSPQFLHITPANHTVKVKDPVYEGNWKYVFDHWNLENSTSNPITVNVTKDVHLIAYYSRTSYSGCPFVYTWNGSEYLMDNNLLPASEGSGGDDVEDNYVLQQTLASRNDRYKSMIGEFEQEHSYFDKVNLLAVDHASDVKVAMSPPGDILTYKDPSAPMSAFDKDGNDVLSLIQEVDEDYYEGYLGDYLVLDFGDLNVEDGAKLVLRADPPPQEKWSVYVQVLNESMLWDTVAIVLPRVYWSTEIVDLSSWLPDPNGDLKVRLIFTTIHRVDFAGLDTTPQEDFALHEGYLLWAIHSEQGFVGWKLRSEDQVYAELLPGQTIRLKFYLAQQDDPEDERTFILYSKGRYLTIP